MSNTMALGERFWSKVEKSDGCWLWIASTRRNGYGQFAVPGHGMLYAHRLAYEHIVGPIPADKELDHLCRVRHCVNPKHLEPVSHAENVRRGARPKWTHCKQGHELTPENLYVYSYSYKSTFRQCRTCAKQRSRDRHSAGSRHQ